MSAKQRAKLLAQDSFAAVQFSHAIMRAFIQALLGVSQQRSSLGVLGDVLAYHFNPEEQNRGSLHYHGFVWLKHKPDTEDFERLLRTPAFQQRVLEYLQAVIKHEHPVFWAYDDMGLRVHLPPGQRISHRSLQQVQRHSQCADGSRC